VKLNVTGNVLLHGAGIPDPAGQTLVLAKFCRAKFALTLIGPVMVKLHVVLVPEAAHAPPQPVNADPVAAPAVSVTFCPLG
jgi:hypothetical protein